jgi:hypothetical protein
MRHVMKYTGKTKAIMTGVKIAALCIIAWIGYETYYSWVALRAAEDVSANGGMEWNLIFLAPVLAVAILLYYTVSAIVSRLAPQ